MEKKINIFIEIGLNPYFENSASANRWRTLIEGLNNLGVKIELLVSNGYNSVEEIRSLKRNSTNNGITIRYLNFLYSGNIWSRRLNSYVLSKLIKPFVHYRILQIAKKNPNAIFWTSSDLDSFKLAVRLKKDNPKVKTFLEMSEFLDIHLFNKSNYKHLKDGNARLWYFENKAIFAYDGMALMTKTLMSHYKSFGQKKPELIHIPMTVDIERFEHDSEIVEGFEKPYIAFVGIMNNAKDGVDVLINAFSKISILYPNYKLYLVGPWHYDTPDHLKMIFDFGLKDKVFWKGVYPRDLVTRIIKNANLLALPRPDSKQAQGGFPTKLGEYLASGVPVCATTVGEIPDYLVDNESVFFADPGSIDSFAKAMERALSDSIIAKNIGFKGKEVAKENFDKDKQSLVLFNFLNKLIEN
jgi:glycosyltransferase involved in cell wall biosynthesis